MQEGGGEWGVRLAAGAAPSSMEGASRQGRLQWGWRAAGPPCPPAAPLGPWPPAGPPGPLLPFPPAWPPVRVVEDEFGPGVTQLGLCLWLVAWARVRACGRGVRPSRLIKGGGLVACAWASFGSWGGSKTQS